jgi:hypothetical protein
MAHGRDHWKVLLNALINFFIPKTDGKFMNACTTGSSTRKAEKYEVGLKNGFFWDVTPCDSCNNRRFGGT